MDTNLFWWINRFATRTGWAHGFFTAYANYGIVLFAALLIATYLGARHHGDLRALVGSVWAAAAALIALGIGQLIGGTIDRVRPYEAVSGVHLLIARTSDFSFPSDHATAVGAVAVGLLFTDKRWGTIGAVLAVAMALTRVYVGAHYPSDVLVGLALGAFVAAGGVYVVVPQLTRAAAWINRTAVRALVSCEPRATDEI